MAYRRVAVLAGLLLTAAPFGAHRPVRRRRPQPVAPAFGASLAEWMSPIRGPGGQRRHHERRPTDVNTPAFGGMAAAAPARIASLSKAITGVCVAQLRRCRTAVVHHAARRRAGADLRAAGPAVDPRFKAITIEQLLMHRAGLARESHAGPRRRAISPAASSRSLATPLADDPGGAMSLQQYRLPHARHGRGSRHRQRLRTLLPRRRARPMKVTGTIDPQLRSRASSGGWRVSAVDYARFIQVFEPGSDRPRARWRGQWQDARNGRRAYGLGIAHPAGPSRHHPDAQRPQSRCANAAASYVDQVSQRLDRGRDVRRRLRAPASPTFAAASKPPSPASEYPCSRGYLVLKGRPLRTPPRPSESAHRRQLVAP